MRVNYNLFIFCQSCANRSIASSVSGSVIISINTDGVTVRSWAPASRALAASEGVHFCDWRGVSGNSVDPTVYHFGLWKTGITLLEVRCYRYETYSGLTEPLQASDGKLHLYGLFGGSRWEAAQYPVGIFLINGALVDCHFTDRLRRPLLVCLPSVLLGFGEG